MTCALCPAPPAPGRRFCPLCLTSGTARTFLDAEMEQQRATALTPALRTVMPRGEDRHTTTVDGAAGYERRRSEAVDEPHPDNCRCSRACVREAM